MRFCYICAILSAEDGGDAGLPPDCETELCAGSFRIVRPISGNLDCLRNTIMKNRQYWKYGCFSIAVALMLCCVHFARLDMLLRRYCKDALFQSYLGQYGLYLLFLLTAAYLLYTLYLWLIEKPSHRQALYATLIVVCLCAFFSGGYLQYHQQVYAQSSQQAKYQKMYDKGLLYDLRGLFK